MMIERRSVSEMEPWWRVGKAPNRARHPGASHAQHDGYTLLVVKFDDQGIAYEAAQMRALQAELDLSDAGGIGCLNSGAATLTIARRGGV
jgi:hypothetical protein